MLVRALIITEPDGTKRLVPFEQRVLSLGRAKTCDIVLADTGLEVSRRHAILEGSPDSAVTISDGSVNGTLVNGKRIRGPEILHNADSISIGPYRIEFRETLESEWPWHVEAGSEELSSFQQDNQLPDAPHPGAPDLVSEALKNLELVHEVGITLARARTVNEVVGQAIQFLFKIEGTHRGTLWLWGEGERCFHQTPLQTRVGPDAPLGTTFDPHDLVLSTTILRHVRQQNRPLLIRDVHSPEFNMSASIMHAGIKSALCSPLTSEGRFLGVLYADNLARSDAFSPEGFRTFSIIAAQAGMALAHALARHELSLQELERATMRRYLPPQVVDLITAKGGTLELGGVLQPVTVLFADIRGFTRLSEGMDAQEVVNMLNEFFGVMTAAIFEAEGTLDKFIGDSVMALFGAPLPSPQSAANALAAAALMQRRVAQLSAEHRQRGVQPLRIGIGLHHGLAVVGNIGSTERMQYTAIGDTVNVAARLVERAQPGQILASRAVYEMSGDNGLFEDLGLISVKGRDAKLRAYSFDWQQANPKRQAAERRH